MNTPIIALALAVAPTSYTPRVPFDVSDVEVESGDNSSHVITYDAEGEVSANIVIWAAPSGVVHLDADFADGRYLSATVDGEQVTIDSDDPTEVAAHMDRIKDYLAAEPGTQERSWTECAGKTLVAGGVRDRYRPCLCRVDLPGGVRVLAAPQFWRSGVLLT